MVLITVSLDCFSPETLFGQQPNRAESAPPPVAWVRMRRNDVQSEGLSSSARSSCRRRGVEIGVWPDIPLVPNPAPHLRPAAAAWGLQAGSKSRRVKRMPARMHPREMALLCFPTGIS